MFNKNNGSRDLSGRDYDNSMKESRKAKQAEYFQQLQQQEKASNQLCSNNPDDSSNQVVGRSSNRVTRKSRDSVENENLGTGFNIGMDPDARKYQEKLKRQEYARQLDAQIVEKSPSKPSSANRNYPSDYQYENSNSYKQDRNSKYSSEVEDSLPPYLASNRSNPQVRHPRRPSNSETSIGSILTFGQDRQADLDDKHKKREKQQEYFNQLTKEAAISQSLRSNDDNVNDRRSFKSGNYDSYKPGQNLNGNRADALQGEGTGLNIGERQGQRVQSRPRISQSDPEDIEKRRLAQQDYNRQLDQDNHIKLQGHQSNRSLSSGRIGRTQDSGSVGTGFNIGHKQDDSLESRRQRQQDYALALARDAELNPQSNIGRSSSVKREPRKSSDSNLYDNSNESYGINMPSDRKYQQQASNAVRDTRIDLSSFSRQQQAAAQSEPRTGISLQGNSSKSGQSSWDRIQGSQYNNNGVNGRNASDSTSGRYRGRGNSSGGGMSSILFG